MKRKKSEKKKKARSLRVAKTPPTQFATTVGACSHEWRERFNYPFDVAAGEYRGITYDYRRCVHCGLLQYKEFNTAVWLAQQLLPHQVARIHQIV
jgi:hypothetical protein